MNDQQVLRRPFDIETHKKTFINYLEVVIDLDGTIMYAVPSHQEKLIALACERHDKTRDELNDLCPQEYYFDFMTWLVLMTGVIPVWGNAGYMGEPTDEQAKALKELADAGLYNGRLPEIEED